MSTILALLLATGAGAAEPPDTRRIELLAAGCNACHGVDGSGSAPIPALRGRDDLRDLLEDWRAAPEAAGRAHVMIRFARGLDEADSQGLADHYAGEVPP